MDDDRLSFGVLARDVLLTYDTRSTANRVRRAIAAFLSARPKATRDEIASAGRLAGQTPGVTAARIVAQWLRSEAVAVAQGWNASHPETPTRVPPTRLPRPRRRRVLLRLP